MKPDVLLTELTALADTLGVKVTYEALGASVGHGGICRVKGAVRVIIDKRAGTAERVATLAEALATLPTDELELAAPVRGILTQYAVRRAS